MPAPADNVKWPTVAESAHVPNALARFIIPCYLKQTSGIRYSPAKAGAAWVDPLEGAFPCEKHLCCRLGWEQLQRW
jgi:hypothetical protein